MQERNVISAARPIERTGFLTRLDAWLQKRQQRAVEAWLGTSQNVSELEARMRDLDRGVPHPFY